MKCTGFAVLVLMCFVLSGNARPSLRLRSRPLDNSETWNNVMVMSKHAQARDRDHETRLIPEMSSDKLKKGDVCCVNVRILDYYLHHILHQGLKEQYPRLTQVKADLHRVFRDLEPHCNATERQSNPEHLDTFKENLSRAGEMYKSNSTARNKAIGETDILFHYLYESCSPHKSS